MTTRMRRPIPRGRGYYVGNDNNGNRIMAYTVRLEVNSDYAALRLVTSTDNIDNVILSAIAVFTVICMAIVIFCCDFGRLFCKIHCDAGTEIGVAARKIASGDLDTRLYKNSDDELGEL